MNRQVLSWCLFDFANSSYSAVIAAVVFPVYYTQTVVGNEAGQGDLWWGRAIALSMALVAVSSPFLGGIADYARIRKRLLSLFTALCIASVASFSLLGQGMVLEGFFLIVLANIGLEGGLVFYNSFLPAVREGRRVLAFTSPGDAAAQAFAREVGVAWAGGSDEPAPEPLDAALIFAPVGALVPKALRDVKKGGAVVCGGIHMSDIPGFPYADLWGERQVRSVANLTRDDGAKFMSVVARGGIATRVRTYPLSAATDALADLRRGAINGTAVLDCR